MKLQNVDKYMATWIGNNHTGKIELYKHISGNKYEIIGTMKLKDPAEFTAVVDLLRNEKPIVYNSDAQAVTTGAEPTGEEESS